MVSRLDVSVFGLQPRLRHSFDANYGAGFAVSLDDEFSDDHPTYMKKRSGQIGTAAAAGRRGTHAGFRSYGVTK